MTTPDRAMVSVVSGFRLPLEGARLLLRERRLWSLALVPLLLSLAAFATAITVVITYAGDLHGWATAWLPELEAASWYAWLWIGPAKLAVTALGAVLFLAIAGGCLVAAYLVASVLAAPFHDALSLRVEQIVTGSVRDETESGLLGLVREAGRSLREEVRKIAFYVAVAGSLAALGFLVPGAQLVTGPAILGFTIFFLPLDYAGYTLDRRRFSFPEKRRWILAHAPAAAGFGGAAFLTCVVPLLNFVAMPILVVAGTLLVLRLQAKRTQSSEPPAPSSAR